MNNALSKLVQIAKKIPMTAAEREEQRISFSYGSAKIENERVTQDMVRQAAKAMGAETKA